MSPDGAKYDGVKWSSSDSSIATVDGGKVTGVKAGEATITAEAGGKSGTQKITVKDAEVVLNSIAIKGEASGKKGATIQLSITPNPANADASVTWKSSNEGVATIDANGKVTCKAAGDITITAISKKDTGKTATLAFKVTEDVTKKFDMKDVSVTAGQFKTWKITAPSRAAPAVPSALRIQNMPQWTETAESKQSAPVKPKLQSQSNSRMAHPRPRRKN